MAAALRSAPALRDLVLHRNCLADLGACAVGDALAEAAGGSGLHTLDLRSNAITAAGVVALARATVCCPALQVLRLGYNPLGPAGAAIAGTALRNGARLRELGLQACGCGDEGAAALAPALAQALQLQRLDFGA